MLLREALVNVETLVENTVQGKKMYLEGVFMSANKKNKNGRLYPKPVLEKAVDEYIRDYVSQGKALGECGHPDRINVVLEEAAILIEKLYFEGDNVIGKAVVLDTPKGKIIQALLDGGYKAGVSSRGTGSLVKENDVNIVQDDFKLYAIDFVDNPSAYNATPSVIKEAEERSKAFAEFLNYIKNL